MKNSKSITKKLASYKKCLIADTFTPSTANRIKLIRMESNLSFDINIKRSDLNKIWNEVKILDQKVVKHLKK